MIYPYDNNIGLEKGFYNLFKSMKNEIYENVNNISKKYDTQQILITGHSLGGAIATLLSFDILYNNLNYDIKLITFGSPRVGNQHFVENFNKYNIYSKRITHYYDIVPHLPQQFLNYRHISQEIWYNEENTEYKLCNDLDNIEDDYCSNSCAPTECKSSDDHLNYMNISMGSEGYC
jgi:predicted lipase